MQEVFDAKGKKVCICDPGSGRVEILFKGQWTSLQLGVGLDILIRHNGAVTRILRDTENTFSVTTRLIEKEA